MAIDMYLFVELADGSCMILQVLAWSHGLSSSSRGRSGRRAFDYEDEAEEATLGTDGLVEDVSNWTVDRVRKWLRDEVSLGSNSVQMFADHDIDGEALLSLTTFCIEDVKDLIPSIGPRARFMAQVERLLEQNKAYKRQEKVSMNDISITAWFDTSSMQAGFIPLMKREPLPRATLVCYTSGGGGRRYRNPDNDNSMFSTPKGHPIVMVDMKGALCTSISQGGSGGEDRFTCNLTFSPQNHTEFSIFGLSELKEFDVFCKNLGLSEEQKTAYQLRISAGESAANHAMGVTTIHKNEKISVVRWGPHVKWSTSSHRIFPLELQKVVFQLLLIRNRQRNVNSSSTLEKGNPKGFALLNNNLMVFFLGHVAANYNVDPFQHFPFPGEIVDDEDEGNE